MQDGNDTFELETVKTEKDLGVTIDCNLSFRDRDVASQVEAIKRHAKTSSFDVKFRGGRG